MNIKIVQMRSNEKKVEMNLYSLNEKKQFK